jgi:D-inositol-3-phosphate glycosyltransferase
MRIEDWLIQRVSSRLRAIVRAVPGARQLRRYVLSYLAGRRAAQDTEPPRGVFDRPDGMTVAREVVAFVGWALVGQRTAAAVDIVLNDLTTVRATMGAPRPDVRASLREPRAAVACGWTSNIDLTSWPLGELRVKVIATSYSGMSSVIGHRLYTVTGDGFEGHLDEPREGAVIRGDLLVVQGWATIGRRPVSRIDVLLNGRRAGLARLRLVRRDVERHASGDLGPVTGFEYRGQVSSEPSQDVEIALTVHALDGSSVAVPPRHVRMVAAGQAIDEAYVERLRTRTRSALGAVPSRSAAINSDRGLRLLVFTHSLTLGGGQLYLSELLRQLAPTLDHCTVVSPVDGILRPELEGLGIDVTILGDAQQATIERYEDHVRERALFIRGSGCNVVLLNTLGPWSAADACARAGTPFVWAIHESFELSDWIGLNFGAAPPAYVRQRMEAVLGAAHQLIFEARATSEMFARYANTTHRTVMRYGVDTTAITEFARGFDRATARRDRDIPEDATVFLAVGIFEERKSQTCLVEAFAEAAAAHPEARLILVGDHPSDYSDAIHQIIDETEVVNRISVQPITPNIWEWYALADVLVSASDVESLPRSMLECMAFGVPVLSTNVFGVPELVEDGINGWLFGARDIAALMAALNRVLSLTPEERRAAGGAASFRVQQWHSSANYGEAYRVLLAEAIASR